MARKNRQQINTVEAPPVPDPGRAPYTPPEAKERGNGGGVDPNAQPPGEDRVWGVASRARWGGADSVHELNRDSRAIDNGGQEEEEEEEESAGASLSVAELKEALDEAQVEYKASAKKDELVALYDEHVAG